MRVLLIQIRPDKATSDHEFLQVVKQSGLSEDVFTRLDATSTAITPEALEGVDALVIGGSGDYLISQGDIPEIISAIGEVCKVARAKEIPTLGICFGSQILTHTFGGLVQLDTTRAETGTFDITKTSVAEVDPIFGDLPKTFLVQLGHKDHLITLPDGAVQLASSERSPNQAFTFPGEPIYAVLFHPELDVEAIIWRLHHYAKEYGLSEENLRILCSRVKDAPEATKVLERFFSKVVRGGERYGS